MLILGVALGLNQSMSGRGLSQRVRQGGHRGRGRGGGGGGGRGGVNLAVDWRDATGPARNGWSNELSAEAQQAARDLVDVEGGCFCTGARTIENKFKLR